MTSEPIELAVSYLQQGGKKPSPQTVVSALVAAEKQSKQEKRQYSYEDLSGTWRLGFVSGTQTVRSGPNSRPTKKPGKGRFLPSLLKIEITYKEEDIEASPQTFIDSKNRPNVRLNKVDNRVTIGPLQLCLSGPTLFRPKLNILAFDFTEIAVGLGGWTPYKGAIRGGKATRQQFEEQSLKDQAFFTFFRVEPTYIAARGKGGGLALWTRRDR